MKEKYKWKGLSFYPGWQRFRMMYYTPYMGDGLGEKDRINFSFIWGRLYIKLPWAVKIKTEYPFGDEPQYGIYSYRDGKGAADTWWFSWGHKKKVLHMPWQWNWVRTSALGVNDNWFNETKKNRFTGGLRKDGSDDKKPKAFYDKEYWAGKLFEEVHPFTYKNKDGTIDNVLATIQVREREWRWRWFKWLPLKTTSQIRRTIDVNFNDEVGPGKGTWKGGVLGCGANMKKGETPYACLKRMEQERKF